MSKIIMLKGLPASGKSTWAKEQLAKGNYFRISKDDIRRDFFGGFKQNQEKNVLKIRDKLIESALDLKKTVIVDDTNLNPIHERRLRTIAENYGVEFEINDSFLEVTPDECIKRDLHRGENAVGSSVIYEMYAKWLRPDKLQKLEENFEKPRCIIFDIDGTLAHNLSGRNIYDYTRVLEDTPDPFMSLVIDAVKEFGPHYLKVIVVSGREDNCRKETEEWLYKNMLPYDKLYMRETGDRRDDCIVKKEIYEEYIEPEYAVLGVFDDRPRVARMWRNLGLSVAQVGDPYIEF